MFYSGRWWRTPMVMHNSQSVDICFGLIVKKLISSFQDSLECEQSLRIVTRAIVAELRLDWLKRDCSQSVFHALRFPATSFPGWVGENPGNEVGFPVVSRVEKKIFERSFSNLVPRVLSYSSLRSERESGNAPRTRVSLDFSRLPQLRACSQQSWTK